MRDSETFAVWRLGDACLKIGSGATPRGGRRVYEDSGVALIRSQNVGNGRFEREGLAFINEYRAGKLDNVSVESGDILLNITGDSVARVARAPSWTTPARVNQYVAIVRPRPEVFDTAFLFYHFLQPSTQAFMLSMASGGGTRKALTKGMIEGFEVARPPLLEQRAISRILSALDDKIELNLEMNLTLEETAQAVFRSWFVDFDPVVAKADGRKPFGLSDDLAALFPDRFVESELGPIPEGWEVLSLGEAGNWLSGGTPSKKNPDYWGGEFPWISAKSIGFLCRWSEDRITEAALESGAKIAPKGSVLLVVRGMSLASEFRFGVATRELSFNQDLKAIVPTGRVDPALTLLYLASSCPTILELVDEASHGTKRLETQLLQDLQMVVPQPEIQKQLASTLWALIDQMLCNEEENETLAKLRDLLLPKLLSGEIPRRGGRRSRSGGRCPNSPLESLRD